MNFYEHPLVQAVLNRFPGAEIVDVRVGPQINQSIMAKQFVAGSAEWVIAYRDGAFKNVPALPKEPIKDKPEEKEPTTLYGQRVGAHTLARMRMDGKPCTYCKRAMSMRIAGRAPTSDHVVPKSKGGQKVVWACAKCNHEKSDMPLHEWEQFMKEHPEWWTLRGGSATRWRNGIKWESNLEQARECLPARAKAAPAYTLAAMVDRGGPLERGATLPAQPPSGVPIAYPSDPKAQAAFEAVYKDRLHMLRSPAAVERHTMTALETARRLREEAEKRGQPWPLA